MPRYILWTECAEQETHVRFIDRRNITWTSYLKGYADIPDRFETEYHAFEGDHFRAMCQYDQNLTAVYDDYMTPPPQENYDQKVYALN